jgi:hypothetical protein
MPVTINGDGSITGLAVGGLPNGTVDADTLASNAVTSSKIADSSVITSKIASGAVAASSLPAGTVVQTVFKNGTFSTGSLQLNSGSMGNPAWFDTGGAGSSLAAITPIFANSKILVNFMFSLRIADGNRLGVMAYVANNANMTNLARISEYNGASGNESYRNATGGTDWHTHALFAVDDGSYSGSGGQIPMSTSERFYNIGYYMASGNGSNYYGDHSQRVYLILQEIKQ